MDVVNVRARTDFLRPSLPFIGSSEASLIVPEHTTYYHGFLGHACYYLHRYPHGIRHGIRMGRHSVEDFNGSNRLIDPPEALMIHDRA